MCSGGSPTGTSTGDLSRRPALGPTPHLWIELCGQAQQTVLRRPTGHSGEGHGLISQCRLWSSTVDPNSASSFPGQVPVLWEVPSDPWMSQFTAGTHRRGLEQNADSRI